jgi:putative ABC transport system permease protein
MQGLLQDFRYAARSLARAPGFALTAALTLGLGLGVSVAMFSVMNGILLRPLPYDDPDRLVMLWIDDPQHAVTEEGFGFPTYEDWRAMNRVFDDVGACIRDSHFLVERDGVTERALVSLATHNLFSLLGASPAQGRTFTETEDSRGDNVAVISHALWQSRFGPGSPIGESLRIEGRSYEVIGVMPAGFGFPHPETVAWTPWPAEGQLGRLRSVRDGDWLRGIAKLKAGVTLAEAQRDMDRISEILTEKYSASPTFAGYNANVVPLLEQITGASLPRRLWLLLGAVGFVFLIACINVMNLLVVRNEARRRELVIREALGASRGRLVRLRFAESLALSGIALAVGVALAAALVPLIVNAAPASIPRLEEIHLDWTAAGWAVVLATLAALLAAALSGRPPRSALTQGHRSSTGAGASRRLQSAFVVVQVALSLVLLCGVGLFLRSLQAAIDFDPGFARENVLLAELQAPREDRQAPAASPAATGQGDAESFYRELFDRLKAAPGVSAVGATTQFRIWLNPDHSIVVEGEEQSSRIALMGDAVTPGYFEAIGVPLVRGRLFTHADVGRPLAIVTETMASHFWPSLDAVGKRFREADGKTWYTVVGVVGDMRRQGIETTPIAQMFRPGFTGDMTLAVRTSGESRSLVVYVREQVRALAPSAPVPSISTVEQTLEADRAPRRFHTLLLASFAIMALALSAIGLFGLQRYTVERRRREIGLRMAVGAQRGDVVRMVVGQGMRLLLAGGAAGLLGSLWLAEVIQGLLFEVRARDEATLIAAGLVLAAVGVLASYLPARRASKIDPMEALRYE